MNFKHIVALALGIGAIHSAYAQVTYEGCRDFRGVPVASVLDNTINDVAIALIENGQAIIRYNTNVLAQMNEPTRRFFYVHECAHHALGHTVSNPSLQNERQADCWAIRTMRTRMRLSLMELRAIQSDIYQRGQGDWTHLPGPNRAVDIDQCLSGDGGERTPAGFPANYGMQQCACLGFIPSVAREPRCQSGFVRPNQCPGLCPGGLSPFAFVCR